ncbi:hypothetical protein, partial [Serratia sp. CY39337]|uniref:hypothetical protein n=1 Tax=Serratia sp. CY39337 TaxID=3383614 RepID=UPI003FA1143B
MNQRIIAPDIHPLMSVIDKKRKQKAAQPGYANGAILLFRAVTGIDVGNMDNGLLVRIEDIEDVINVGA